ncbi:MAG: ribosome silencing factor [Muribaculaceae bacterium]|nr:ribosome silencing factor [Muribaculaceae bacterium]
MALQDQNITAIINRSLTPLQDAIVDAITDLKGRDITIVDMTHIESAPLSQFIIAQGSSSTNVAAIADRIREKVQAKTGVKPYNYDGYFASEWIVIDYGHLLVHVFLPETRQRYRLEELWSDANITDLPNID